MHTLRLSALVGIASIAAPLSAQVAWTALTPLSTPSPRTEVGMESDTIGALLFGGQFGPGLVAYDELWRFDGTVWSQQVPTGGIAPPPRSRFATAWDAVRQRFVVFGGDGQYTTGGTLGDTWEWDPSTSTWTQAAPSSTPTPRIHARMAFDLVNLKVLLFGGRGAGNAETWAWDGTDWTLLLPSTVPPGREQAHLATNWSNATILMFGGATGAASGVLGDTWQWNGVDWTQLAPATSPGGGGLRNGKATYDTLRDRVVVHGGIRFTGGFSPSAWEWDGSDWIERLPAAAPGGRTGAGFCYVPSLQTSVLFGGYNGGVFGDTWTYQTTAIAALDDYGVGCPSSTGQATLAVAPMPWTAQSLTWTILNVPPGGLPLLVLGTSDSVWAGGALPVPLAVLGAPNCQLFASPDTLTFAPGQVALPIPNDPALAGAQLFAQGAILEPVGSALELSMTAANRATIGVR